MQTIEREGFFDFEGSSSDSDIAGDGGTTVGNGFGTASCLDFGCERFFVMPGI